MREILPDVILPISDDPKRDVCVAMGPGLDEVLWITGRKAVGGKSSFGVPTALQLHSYRPGPEVFRKFSGNFLSPSPMDGKSGTVIQPRKSRCPCLGEVHEPMVPTEWDACRVDGAGRTRPCPPRLR